MITVTDFLIKMVSAYIRLFLWYINIFPTTVNQETVLSNFDTVTGLAQLDFF